MVLRRDSLTEHKAKPGQLLNELKELTTAIAQFSTQIISPYRSALNDLFGECSQLCNLVECLTSLHHRAHHLLFLSEDDLLFVYIDKLTALQANLSLILQNSATVANQYPALWGTAQDISASLHEFAQVHRNAAIIAAKHCRHEFQNLFANNCQQATASLIAARALLLLAGIQPQHSCNVYQRSEAPDQLIFFYENQNVKTIARCQQWLLKQNVKSACYKKIESEKSINFYHQEEDSEATANFQFDEDIVMPVDSSAYEIMVDAGEFSCCIMPMVRAQAVQLSKTPRSQSYSTVVTSSGGLWSSNHSSSAETSKNSSDEINELSSEQDDEIKKLEAMLHGSQKLNQHSTGRTTPRSSTQSPRSQKNGSGMLNSLKALGSSAELKESALRDGALKRSLK